MALIPIMGQPVNLLPDSEQTFTCDDGVSYCVLYGKEAGDEGTPPERIMFEMKQEPCGSTLVSNGGFTDGSSWTVVDGSIVFADGKANHIVGTSAELSQSIIDIDLGTYYKIDVTVTGMSGGTLDIYFTQSGSYSVQITENGIYTFYLYNLTDNDNITFVWSSDCDASISGVSVFKLLDSTEITANLLDADDVIVSPLDIAQFDEFILFSIATSSLTDGCYSVEIIDPCPFASGMTPLFASPDFANPSDWTVTANSPTASIATLGPPYGNVFLFDEDNSVPSPVWAKATQAFAIPTGVKLLLKITVDLCNLGGDSLLNNLVIFAADGGDVQELLRKNINQCISGLSTFYVVVDASFLSPSNLDMGVWIDDNSPSSGNFSFTEYVQVEYAVITNGTSGYFKSNCLTVTTDTTGTRLVEGFADLTDTSSSPSRGRSLGFLFVEDYFWLKARLGLSFTNPHSPIKTENSLYSNGEKSKIYAQVSKAWDLTFHAADENMHDTIANIINCDRFTIDGVEYMTDEKEYTANYGAKGAATVGESTIEVQKVNGTRFNTNA